MTPGRVLGADSVTHLESELDQEAAVARSVAEEFGRPGDALEDGIAMRVQPGRGTRGVLSLVEEHPEGLASAGGGRVVVGERTSVAVTNLAADILDSSLATLQAPAPG
jgi:hypothetical protein